MAYRRPLQLENRFAFRAMAIATPRYDSQVDRRYSTSTRESAGSMAGAGCLPVLKERNHTRFTGLNLFSDGFLGTTAKTRMAF